MKKALITFMKITAFFVGWAVCTAIDIPAEDPAVWRFFAELVPLASMILFTIVFIFIEKKNVRIPIAANARGGTLVVNIALMVFFFHCAKKRTSVK